MLRTLDRTFRLRWSAAVVVMSLVVWLVGGSAAQAAGTYNLYGTVSDVLGRPLAAVSVRNGGQSAMTYASGAYSLSQTTPGSFTLRASRADLAASTKTVDVLVPVETRTDFQLLYRLSGSLDRTVLRTTSAEALTLIARSTVPGPGITLPGGSCVRAQIAGQPDVAASITDVAGDGSSTWRATFTVPQGTAEGAYAIDYWAIECSSGQMLSSVSSTTFAVDNTSPTITAPEPTGWVGAAPTVSVHVDDEWGIDTGSSHLSVDGTRLSSELDVPLSRLRAATGLLSEGHHSAEAVVIDRAGNVTTFDFGFDIDRAAPEAINPTPTGTVDDMSPTLTAHLSDAASGVDPDSIVLVLSNGVLTCQLPATWQSSTGKATYQVPTTVDGACLGRGPLAPGEYSVALSLRDNAANPTALSWTFHVSPGHPSQLL